MPTQIIPFPSSSLGSFFDLQNLRINEALIKGNVNDFKREIGRYIKNLQKRKNWIPETEFPELLTKIVKVLAHCTPEKIKPCLQYLESQGADLGFQTKNPLNPEGEPDWTLWHVACFHFGRFNDKIGPLFDILKESNVPLKNPDALTTLIIEKGYDMALVWVNQHTKESLESTVPKTTKNTISKKI